MTTDRRRILEQVASGELSPEEADDLLRGVTEAPPTEHMTSVTKVVIRAGAGAIEIIGDDAVAQADVEGTHDMTIEGDTLIIHGQMERSVPGAFAINVGRRRRIRVGHDGVQIGRKHFSALRVRMNPNLELDAELDAGPLSISGIKAPVRARLSAGPMTIERFEGPLDLSVNAGAIRAIGILTTGDSRIRSDAGAVRVQLHPSSDVRVKAHAALGKVSLFGDDEHDDFARRFGTDRRHEATLGAGTATLRVDTAMGSVHVSVG
jgi:hypothetical protein